jgi:hypothetical protein
MVRTPEVASGLLFKRAPWDSLDSEFEKKIPFDSPAEHRDCLRRLVESGEAQLWHLIENEKRIGFVVTRVESDAGRELVIVSAYCNGTVPFAREIAETAEKIAIENRCQSIRFHTVRPAAARLAADEFGFRLTELVLRKNVPL